MIGRSVNLRKLDSLRYGYQSACSIPKDFCKSPNDFSVSCGALRRLRQSI